MIPVAVESSTGNPFSLRRILHVDMDAFYAAIEVLDRPELRGRAVVVGAPPDRRGVVCTASYEARKYGVHSAMPSRTAFQRCPHAIFLPPRFERYEEISGRIMDVFLSFTPLVEPLSIDEAFLDVNGALRPGLDAVAIGRELKRRVTDAVRLTCSVGVAPNKFLAKVASDLDKPDGLTVVPDDAEGVLRFLAPLPVSRIWGVGKVTAEHLARLSIRTIADVQRFDEKTLARFVGENFANHLWRLARGLDDRPVITEQEAKSISNEETFDEDRTDLPGVRQCLIELTENVGRRLRASGKLARTAVIKVRFSDFRTLSRQAAFSFPTASDRDLLHTGLDLFDRLRISQPVRLIGFGVTHFLGEGEQAWRQPSLFTEHDEERQVAAARALDSAVDALRRRYGRDALRRGDWGEKSQ